MRWSGGSGQREHLRVGELLAGSMSPTRRYLLSEMASWKVITGDCLEVLKTLPSGSVDAVVTDPPYGISYDGTHSKYHNGIDRGQCEWDNKPFDPSPILALQKPTLLWGGNCFASRLPDATSWAVWVKIVRQDADIRQSDCEMAWTNCLGRSRVFNHLWIGAYRDSESGIRNVHPTQKPIALMCWCLEIMKIPTESTVLDPFCGSGTTGVACVQTGRNFIGIEIDPKYADIARRRIADAVPLWNDHDKDDVKHPELFA